VNRKPPAGGHNTPAIPRSRNGVAIPANLNRGALGGWLLLLHAVVSLGAQPVGRIDLEVSNRYVWHGISRAAGFVLQPSLAAGYQFDRLVLGAGLVRHYEPGGSRPGELSQLASGTDRVGEDDAWVQASLSLGSWRVRSGLTRYIFRSGPPHNSTELSAAISLATRYLTPTLEAWWDIGRVRGGYVSASATSPLFGWPAEPYFFAALTGEVGLNLGQSPDAARPSDLAHFASRGVTHAALGFSVTNRVRHWRGTGSATLSLGLQSQFNFDQATRYDGPGRQDRVTLWLTAGITVVLGGEAKRAR
jgi:hypothetical protein